MKKLILILLCGLAFGQATLSTAPSSTGSITASGSTCGTTNACVVLHLPASTSSVAVTVSGTFSATLKVEKSADNGTNWVSAGSDVTSAGQTTYTILSQTDFRVRASAYVSGTAVVFINSSTAATTSGGMGTVTSVATTSPITGGTFTDTGTIGCATCAATTNRMDQNDAATTSAQFFGVISDETGSGAVVGATSPTLVTPALGTPTALVLTSATGLPLTTGVTGVLPTANGGDKGAVLVGFCQTTVGTANATEYSMLPFSTSSVNCSAASATEMPVPYACTMSHLTVKAGAAGAVVGSGIIKVYKNLSATGITCTLGTGTTCTDAVNTASYAANDTFKITVTTGQATDTTANIRASLQCQ